MRRMAGTSRIECLPYLVETFFSERRARSRNASLATCQKGGGANVFYARAAQASREQGVLASSLLPLLTTVTRVCLLF